VIALFLPMFSRLFLGAPPATFSIYQSKMYFPPTTFISEIREHTDITRVALVKTPDGGTMHPNGPVRLGLPTVTGYRNPNFKEYFDLYNYHRLLLEKDSAEITKSFDDFRKTTNYLKNSLTAWSLPDSEWELSDATKRYFRLHQINAVIGSDDLIINDPDWEKVVDVNGLALWKDKIAPSPFLFATEIIVIPDSLYRLQYMLSDANWNMDSQAVVAEGVGVKYNSDSGPPSNLQLLESVDGYRLIDAKNK